MALVDTGFFVAIANRRDRHHECARAAAAKLREPLVTTWPVLTEASHLLLRLGVDAEVRLMEAVAAGALDVFAMNAAHASRIAELMLKYAQLPMDLADASLVIAAEALGSGRILSTDERDFGAYRWKSRKPFTNLLI